MIKVKIRGPTTLQNVVASMEKEYSFDRRALWIGRGEEISQKQNEHNYVLNVGDISKSVSRIHACLLFSPAFWMGYDFVYPSYFKKLGQNFASLPQNVLFQIWQFVRPARKIILKDIHSKTGTYKKISYASFSIGLEIVLGDSRPLVFHHQERYDSWQELKDRVNWLKEKQYYILNEDGDNLGAVRSFWIMTYRHQHFILLDYPSKLTIGRSSNSNLVICQASISRKHAILEYNHSHWKIFDGDGSTPSSNGMWERVKKLELEFRNKEKEMTKGESTVKLGDILFTFQIKQDYSYLNVTQLCSYFKNSTVNDSLTSAMKSEEVYPLFQGSSHL